MCRYACQWLWSSRIMANRWSATIYSDPNCSFNATISDLNTCMSGGMIVGSFSIDCQSTDPTSAAYTPASGPSSTDSTFVTTGANGAKKTSSSTSASSTTDSTANSKQTSSANASNAQRGSNDGNNSEFGITTGALAGIVVGCVVLVALLPIAYWLRRHMKRKNQSRTAPGALKNEVNEIYGGETAELPPTHPRPPQPPPLGAAFAKSFSNANGGYIWRAEVDGVTLGSNTGASPPGYYDREKQLQPVPVAVQNPGVYAELPTESMNVSMGTSTSPTRPSRAYNSDRNDHTSPASPRPLIPQEPDMGQPF
jgi:hypothetical protein